MWPPKTAARLPDAAATARSAIEDANRQMRGGSDEMLTVGSALSFGLAAGLLIGGAPRVIVVGAFIPAVAMVLTMFNRANPGRGPVGRSMQAADTEGVLDARVAATPGILP